MPLIKQRNSLHRLPLDLWDCLNEFRIFNCIKQRMLFLDRKDVRVQHDRFN